MPTPRKPVDLQTKKMGKEERAARKEAEIDIGKHKFVVPPDVKVDKEAYKKWREITKIYKDANLKLVTTSDTGTMSRYCLVYSEYLDLVRKRAKIRQIELPEMGDEDYKASHITMDEIGRKRAQRLYDLMEYFTTLDGLIRLDKNINSKLKTLLDLENTLFLNPLAKIRSVPVEKAPKKKDEAADDGFDV